MGLRQIACVIVGFAAVSGVGLALDFGLFLLLIRFGLTSTSANFLSATAAVTFVYFASVSQVFSYQGRLLLPLFLAYLTYQATAVAAASFAVGYLARHWMSPPLAKITVLPLTFSANFLFMLLLTRRRQAVTGKA